MRKKNAANFNLKGVLGSPNIVFAQLNLSPFGSKNWQNIALRPGMSFKYNFFTKYDPLTRRLDFSQLVAIHH